MPQSIFEEGTFVCGAKIWVMNLVWGIAIVIAAVVLLCIPYLGPIVLVLGAFLFGLVLPLLNFQVGLTGKISAGFTGIGRAFKLLFKRPIKTLSCTLAPSFILTSIVEIFGFIFVAIFLLISFNTMPKTMASLVSKSTYMLATSGALVTILFFCAILLAIAEALSNVWTMRSLGHLVSREAVEWLKIPGFVDTANIEGTNVPKPYVPLEELQKSASQI